VVAVPEELRLVVAVPVLRLEEELLLPELRLTEEPEELLREVRSFCTDAVRLCDAAEEGRLEELDTAPEDRLEEEDPRVVVCEEDDRDEPADPPEERRVWAKASGAATIAMARNRAAAVLIILLMAFKF
jgi:hypothetical protein